MQTQNQYYFNDFIFVLSTGNVEFLNPFQFEVQTRMFPYSAFPVVFQASSRPSLVVAHYGASFYFLVELPFEQDAT